MLWRVEIDNADAAVVILWLLSMPSGVDRIDNPRIVKEKLFLTFNYVDQVSLITVSGQIGTF